MIFDESARGSESTKMPLAEVKFLPEKFIGVIATEIYGNKVGLFFWTEDPFVIMIESKELADSYRKFFNLLWETAKE
jgi:hypothetical protein